MDTKLNEKIVKKGSKWQVQSEKGRNMGTYDTKEEAEKRLKQVHYFKNLKSINEDKINTDNIKITSREKGLQILYWLEDKGIDANFSEWNENSYYFNFNDERDYNNALILLYEYCGEDSIRYDDYSRMEIEVDVDKAYPRLKNNVNSKYMGDSLNEEINEEDSITEQLLESDSVEDDLEDIIRDTIEENKNENSKIILFEVDSDDEDSRKMWIKNFDDIQVDFRKLTIYPHEKTEDGASKPVASFMLGGGLNGSGNWTNYLDDLQKLFEKLKEATELEPLIYEESTDITDDVWDVKVFMYDHNEEDYPLDEGLFNPQSNEDIIDDMIKYYDDYAVNDRSLESILDNILTKYNYNIEDYDTIDQVPSEVWLDFYEEAKDYYQKEVDKYGDGAEIPTEAFDVFDLNSFDPEEHINEDCIDETYSKDELDSFKNKVFNQRKIMSIYRKKKYGKNRLMCRTKCVNCGREKKLFLSNLVTNPEKYGSCICSDKNIESRYDTINGLYKGTKKLRNNTSGYTGVSWVSTYAGEPYNKWRAYIDIDGQRNYLGDFSSKSKAIRARKAAAAKGVKWYAENKDQFMANSRRRRKRKRKLKTKVSTANN